MCTLPTVTPNDANVRTRHGMRPANPCTPNNRHAWRWLRMSSQTCLCSCHYIVLTLMISMLISIWMLTLIIIE